MNFLYDCGPQYMMIHWSVIALPEMCDYSQLISANFLGLHRSDYSMYKSNYTIDKSFYFYASFCCIVANIFSRIKLRLKKNLQILFNIKQSDGSGENWIQEQNQNQNQNQYKKKAPKPNQLNQTNKKYTISPPQRQKKKMQQQKTGKQ